MPPNIPNKSLLLLLLILFPFSIPFTISSGLEDGCCIQGQVRIPTEAKDLNAKVVLNGGQNITFLKPNGTFSFHNVHSGTHLIEVVAIGFFFYPVWIEVDARTDKVKATLSTRYDEVILSELLLMPVKRREEYYQIRRPFSVTAVVKTPMGTMVGLMLILVVAMSNLMNKMDPEELKRAQEEMKNERISSFLNFLFSILRGRGIAVSVIAKTRTMNSRLICHDSYESPTN